MTIREKCEEAIVGGDLAGLGFDQGLLGCRQLANDLGGAGDDGEVMEIETPAVAGDDAEFFGDIGHWEIPSHCALPFGLPAAACAARSASFADSITP